MMKVWFYLWLVVHLTPSNGQFGELKLAFQNIGEKKGKIWIAVYDTPNHFMNKEKAVLTEVIDVAQAEKYVFTLQRLPFGTYAIAAFHDLNNNDQLDQTFVGIPKEPYAFSKKLKSKWKPPVFEDVMFNFSQPDQTVLMQLEEW